MCRLSVVNMNDMFLCSVSIRICFFYSPTVFASINTFVSVHSSMCTLNGKV